jgi:hypothetical protein
MNAVEIEEAISALAEQPFDGSARQLRPSVVRSARARFDELYSHLPAARGAARPAAAVGGVFLYRPARNASHA